MVHPWTGHKHSCTRNFQFPACRFHKLTKASDSSLDGYIAYPWLEGATNEGHIDCYIWESLVKDLAIRNELSRNAIDMFVSMNEYYTRGRFILSDIEYGVDEAMDLSAVGQCWPPQEPECEYSRHHL